MSQLATLTVPNPRWVYQNQAQYFEMSLKSHPINDRKTAKQYADVIEKVASEIHNRRSLIIRPKLIIAP